MALTWPGSQGEWTGTHMREQWLLCTGQWGWQMLLSEHAYCVAITFKMIEQAEQWICIKFCIKLEHSSTETIRMIQLQLWATGDWQLHHDNTPTHVSCLVQSFLVKHQITQVIWPAPLQPRFGTLQLLAFPKTKIIFESKEISDLQWDLGKYDGAADGAWENCVRSKGAYFEGDWGITVLCTMFLISRIFFKKCLYFSYYLAGYLLDRPRMLITRCFCFCALI